MAKVIKIKVIQDLLKGIRSACVHAAEDNGVKEMPHSFMLMFESRKPNEVGFYSADETGPINAEFISVLPNYNPVSLIMREIFFKSGSYAKFIWDCNMERNQFCNFIFQIDFTSEDEILTIVGE